MWEVGPQYGDAGRWWNLGGCIYVTGNPPLEDIKVLLVGFELVLAKLSSLSSFLAQNVISGSHRGSTWCQSLSGPY